MISLVKMRSGFKEIVLRLNSILFKRSMIGLKRNIGQLKKELLRIGHSLM